MIFGYPELSQWSLTLEVRKSGRKQDRVIEKFVSQWSLTLEVRKSTLRHRNQPHRERVAMEPDLGGQEKNQDMGDYLKIAKSQWSLTLEVRKSFQHRHLDIRGHEVAMEPDLGGQEKYVSDTEALISWGGRNGA